MNVFIVIDIEKINPRFELGTIAGVAAIAFTIQDNIAIKLGEFSRDINVDWSKADPDTLEWWDNNAKDYKQKVMNSNVKDNMNVWLYFYEFIYGFKDSNIIFISDNPTFDFSHIDYYLQQYYKIKSLRTFNGKYLQVWDINSMILSLFTPYQPPYKAKQFLVSQYSQTFRKNLGQFYNTKYTHDPLDDCKYIAKVFIIIYFLRFIKM